MSLRHALLGLLVDEQASGYELTQRFSRELGRYAWQAGHTAIYPELVKMANVGLIEVVATGARGRKTYGLTAAGREELRSWLLSRPDDTVVRDERVLRMFLIQALEPHEARPLLESIAERSEEELARLRPILEQLDAESAETGDPTPFGRIAGEYGIRQYEATASWARWAVARLDARTALT